MKTFEWCGYNWMASMEGDRIIHTDAPWQWYGLDGIDIERHNLYMYIQKIPKVVKYYNGTVYFTEYEVPLIRSVEEFDFGTFSCEIRVPDGTYLSSSFWLTGSHNWPPEIDIMEGWTNNNCWFRIGERYFPYLNPSWRTTTNVHYRDEMLNKTHVGTRNISILKQFKHPADNFIKYACEWFPDRITFYANDKKVREIKGDVCEKLVKNLKNPDRGYKMNVVFNVWMEDPSNYNVAQYSPMVIRNFKYEEYGL